MNPDDDIVEEFVVTRHEDGTLVWHVYDHREERESNIVEDATPRQIVRGVKSWLIQRLREGVIDGLMLDEEDL